MEDKLEGPRNPEVQADENTAFAITSQIASNFAIKIAV